MTDLVAFLRARLDEDEQAARAASPSPWKDPEEDEAVSLWLTREDAYHIYRWEPARVLRKVEAERRILRDLEEAERSLAVATSGPPHDLMTGAVNTLRRIVRLHACEHADHPDYREEWSRDVRDLLADLDALPKNLRADLRPNLPPPQRMPRGWRDVLRCLLGRHHVELSSRNMGMLIERCSCGAIRVNGYRWAESHPFRITDADGYTRRQRRAYRRVAAAVDRTARRHFPEG